MNRVECPYCGSIYIRPALQPGQGLLCEACDKVFVPVLSQQSAAAVLPPSAEASSDSGKPGEGRWVRKDSAEIGSVVTKKRSRWLPHWELLLGTVSFGILCFYLGQTDHVTKLGIVILAHTWRQAADAAIAVSIGSFLVLYLLQIIGLLHDDPVEVCICPECFEIQNQSIAGCCRCGSELEPFHNWKWVPGKKRGQEPPCP